MRILSRLGLMGCMATATAALFLVGCAGGMPIKYALKGNNVAVSKSTRPMRVLVAPFSDNRPSVERERSSRKAKRDSDLGDYTYDNEFRGNVADGITKMVIEHLKYAKMFSPNVAVAPFKSREVTDSRLDSLAHRGVGAVMVGEIDHFYGYYDNKLWRRFVYEFPLGVASGLISLRYLSFAIGGYRYFR